jgi:hypothetical protein
MYTWRTALPDFLNVRLFHVLLCADGMCGAEVSGEADRVGDLDEAVGKGSVAMYIQPPSLSARFDPAEHEAGGHGHSLETYDQLSGWDGLCPDDGSRC